MPDFGFLFHCQSLSEPQTFYCLSQDLKKFIVRPPKVRLTLPPARLCSEGGGSFLHARRNPCTGFSNPCTWVSKDFLGISLSLVHSQPIAWADATLSHPDTLILELEHQRWRWQHRHSYPSHRNNKTKFKRKSPASDAVAMSKKYLLRPSLGHKSVIDSFESESDYCQLCRSARPRVWR